MNMPALSKQGLTAAATLLMLAACATGPRVTTDFDPTADLGRYRSYAFYQPLAMEQSGYSTYLTDRIKSGIRREMDARGYVFDATRPDLRVNFQGIVQEKTDVWTVPRTDYHIVYGYRRSFLVPVWYDQTEVRQYDEGTLTVDLIDAAANRMVWTGSAIGRVTQASPEERATASDQAVAAIFERYPARASTP